MKILCYVFLMLISARAKAAVDCIGECGKLYYSGYSVKNLSQLEGISLILHGQGTSLDPQKIVFQKNLPSSKQALVLKLSAMSTDPKFTNPTGFTDQYIDVEIGAFRLVLKDGRELYDTHTSNIPDSVSELDIQQSLDRVFESHNLLIRDVAIIEYFHTHPTYLNRHEPLSIRDSKFVTDWLIPLLKSKNNGKCPTVNLYAISKTSDGEFFVYESTYRL